MKYMIENTREVEQYFFNDPQKGRSFEVLCKKNTFGKRQRRRDLKPEFKAKNREVWN